ncbi:MAG: hypothetical protein JW990_13445 [Thermoleophilia bacterium]|nr:hypothetical protein [Thermoleophilia bacterium]
MNSTTDHRDKTPWQTRFSRALRERWWVIVLTMLVIGVVALAVSFLVESRYKATAQVVYSSREAHLASQALTSSGSAELLHNVSSDALTLRTSEFVSRVGTVLGSSASVDSLRELVTIKPQPQLDVIQIDAAESDPVRAAEIANAFAAEFVAQRRESIETLLTNASHFIESRIASLTPEEEETGLGTALKQQHDDLALSLAMEIADYQILEKAVAPSSPYSPRPWTSLLIGLAGGLLLGLLVTWILERRDPILKDQSALRAVMDFPVIASVPLGMRKKGKALPATGAAIGFRQGNEALLESIRMLRANLKVLGFGESRRSVLITSASPGEAKSMLAANLALGMALSGDRVILVDADLHAPAIHKYLELHNDRGLGDVLKEKDIPWSSKIQVVELAPFVDPGMLPAAESQDGRTVISRFPCITSGPLPYNASDVLESGPLGEVLDELQGFSDYVILDGPPLSAADALTVALTVDAVVLAGALGKETAPEALNARELLRQAEIPVLGIVTCTEKPQPDAARYLHAPTEEYDEEPL